MGWRDVQYRNLPRFAHEHYAEAWRRDRQLARTDLRWLCHNVLGFKDIVDHAHGEIIDSLQKFKGFEEQVNPHPTRFGVAWKREICPLWDLEHHEGPRGRQHLLLASRGHLKTTINCVAHSIQWILNYPDIRILVTTSTEKLAKEIMSAIAQAFETNPAMKHLFPEFCSKGNKQLGNSEQFTVPNRKDLSKKEPTVSIITATSAMAGPHYDVIKHSDVIDQFNSKTPGGLDTIRSHFTMCIPLLERNQDSKGNPKRGWRTVEGTIYSFADFHSEILEQQMALPEKERTWLVTRQSCWANDEKTATVWPERFSVEDLKQTEMEMGKESFANQYELNPIPDGTGLTTKEQLAKCWIPRRILDAIQPTLRLHVTIDLAGLEKDSTGDFTVVTVAGFDRVGRMYVLEVHRGHYDGHEVVNLMFDIDRRYNGRILDYKIEKEAHARGLRSTLEREQAIRQQFLIITYLQRDNRISKVERIKHGLRYWFSAGIIRFAEDIPCKSDIEDEVLRFPKWKHDDILDTFVDQTQNQDSGYEPDVLPMPKKQHDSPYRPPPFVGFGEDGEPRWGGHQEPMTNHYDEVTGV